MLPVFRKWVGLSFASDGDGSDELTLGQLIKIKMFPARGKI